MSSREIRALDGSVGSVLRGKRKAVKMSIVCLLARGHLLIEDVPGVGKTTLALSLARSINASFQRIQFTSDLLPADITGVSIYNPETRQFEFKPGPVFANIVLADEINRTNPKTQSALLEAMNERHVSADGKTYPLPEPFMVIATQNPVEHHGTFPLPESQLDRFMMHLTLGYPAHEDEKQVLLEHMGFAQIERMKPVLDAADVVRMQDGADQVRADESILDYILAIVAETRRHDRIVLGASTRGARFLLRAAMAHAFFEGRDYAVPGDVKETAPHVLGHRIILKSHAADPDGIVAEIIRRVPVPV
jgi:MoxR-like ATPase